MLELLAAVSIMGENWHAVKCKWINSHIVDICVGHVLYSNVENLSHWGAGSPVVGLPYGTLAGTLTSFLSVDSQILVWL